MFDSFRQFLRDLVALPRSIKCLAGGLAVGIGCGIGALTRAGAGAGLWVPLIATLSAAILLSLGVGWLARRVTRARSRGLATALWERMTRRATPTAKAAAEAERVLQQRWRDVHALLESKDYDYYTLPWYLIVGATQSGKTTLVQRSSLEFPIGDQPVAEFGSTKDCNWFFTNKAILIDTAGRYVDQHLKAERGEAERESRAEWLQFLALLRRHRRRSPLNGLILAVKVEDVLAGEPRARQRIGEMLRDAMRDVETNLGVRMPVYVMVTMCDRVLGFADFFRSLGGLTERSLLGWSRGGEFDAPFAPTEFDQGVARLLQRLNELRLELLRDQRGSTIEPPDTAALDRMYAFPDEFAEVAAALREVLAVAFATSTYHQSHFLRGVYFTSSLQKGTPLRELWRRLLGEVPTPATPQAEPAAAAAAPDSKAYFVADFFEEKVFQEVGLVVPTARTERRRRLAARLGLIGAAACVLAVLGCAVWDVSAIQRPVAVLARKPAEGLASGTLRQVTDAAVRISDIAGDREPVDQALVKHWVEAVQAVATAVQSTLTPGHPLDERLEPVTSVLAADCGQLRTSLCELFPDGGAERIQNACLTEIREGLQPASQQLVTALCEAGRKWREAVEKLSGGPGTFTGAGERGAWRDIALVQVQAKLTSSAKRLKELVEQAARESPPCESVARLWKAEISQISTLGHAAEQWRNCPATTPAAATLERLRSASTRLSAKAEFPQVSSDSTTSTTTDLSAAQERLAKLGAIVGFDPAQSPLLAASVWDLADWSTDAALPPGLELPEAIDKPESVGVFAGVFVAADECRAQLGQRVTTALLKHIRDSRSLPLASYPYRSTSAVAATEPWAKSQFTCAAAEAAARLFANLRKRAQDNEASIREAESDYAKHFKAYWRGALAADIHTESRSSTVEEAMESMRKPRLELSKWIDRLGLNTIGEKVAANTADGLLRWVADLVKQNPIDATERAAEKLDELAANCLDRNVDAVLRAAPAAHQVLVSVLRLSGGDEPLRRAVVSRAKHMQSALKVIAKHVFQSHWIAPDFQGSALFPLDGGAALRSPDADPKPIDPERLRGWFEHTDLTRLAELIWPAYDPLNSAYGLFDADMSQPQEDCFVAVMQLRAILLHRDLRLVLTSHAEASHTLDAPGEVRITADDGRAHRISPNNFHELLTCDASQSFVTFVLKRGSESWRVPSVADDWEHFRLLALLYSHRQSAQDGKLVCRIVFRQPQRAPSTTPIADGESRFAHRDSLSFVASVDGLSLPAQLPDLSKAHFFAPPTTRGN